jgi:hypothetical protein
LIKESIDTKDAGDWTCSPYTPLTGNFALFAQGQTDSQATSWDPASPINALHDFYNVTASAADYMANEGVFFAFGLIHMARASNVVLRLESLADGEVTRRLRASQFIERRLRRQGEPAKAAEITWYLGREKIVPPPMALPGRVELQYTGGLEAKVAKALVTGKPMSATETFSLPPGELHQGILRVTKKKPTDWCVVRGELFHFDQHGAIGGATGALVGGFILSC